MGILKFLFDRKKDFGTPDTTIYYDRCVRFINAFLIGSCVENYVISNNIPREYIKHFEYNFSKCLILNEDIHWMKKYLSDDKSVTKSNYQFLYEVVPQQKWIVPFDYSINFFKNSIKAIMGAIDQINYYSNHHNGDKYIEAAGELIKLFIKYNNSDIDSNKHYLYTGPNFVFYCASYFIFYSRAKDYFEVNMISFIYKLYRIIFGDSIAFVAVARQMCAIVMHNTDEFSKIYNTKAMNDKRKKIFSYGFEDKYVNIDSLSVLSKRIIFDEYNHTLLSG